MKKRTSIISNCENESNQKRVKKKLCVSSLEEPVSGTRRETVGTGTSNTTEGIRLKAEDSESDDNNESVNSCPSQPSRKLGSGVTSFQNKKKRHVDLEEEESEEESEYVFHANDEGQATSSPGNFSEDSNDPQISSNIVDVEIKEEPYDSDNSSSLIIKSEPEDVEHSINAQNEVDINYLVADEKVSASFKNIGIPLDRMRDGFPYLQIIDQPEPSYRFRYKRESNRPHGPMKGRAFAHTTQRNSQGPSVKLCNFQGEEAVLRVWLYCSDGPSPHQLVSTPLASKRTRDSSLVYEPHHVVVDRTTDFVGSFDRLNILHVVCGSPEYHQQYYEKKVFSSSDSFLFPTNLPPFNPAEIKDEIKRKEKDIACLFFEAFEKTSDGFRKLCDIFSEDIRNKKSPKTNDLRIIRQSHEVGSCRGNQQVFIFTERIIKDVFIEFFEEDEDGEITWSAKASFKESDIHKQVAICFWTPPYKDLHITKSVGVFFRLVRTTDGAYSHNRTYQYLPSDCPCNAPCTPMSYDAPRWPRELKCRSPERVIPTANRCVQVDIKPLTLKRNESTQTIVAKRASESQPVTCVSELKSGVYTIKVNGTHNSSVNQIVSDLGSSVARQKLLVTRRLLPVDSKLVPIKDLSKLIPNSVKIVNTRPNMFKNGD